MITNLQSAMVQLQRDFNTYDPAGDANHSRTNGGRDGVVSMVDILAVASGKSYDGTPYSKEDVEAAKFIIAHQGQFRAQLNQDSFKLSDLTAAINSYQDNKTVPPGGPHGDLEYQKRYRLLLNVYDQIDTDHSGILSKAEMEAFIAKRPKNGEYKSTFDAVEKTLEINKDKWDTFTWAKNSILNWILH